MILATIRLPVAWSQHNDRCSRLGRPGINGGLSLSITRRCLVNTGGRGPQQGQMSRYERQRFEGDQKRESAKRAVSPTVMLPRPPHRLKEP